MTWAAFALALLIGCALLALPSGLSFWALRSLRGWVVALAPAYAVVVYTVTGTFLERVGVSGLAALLALSFVLASCVGALVALFCRRKGGGESQTWDLDWRLLALYVGASSVVMAWFFLGNLAAPDAFVLEAGDNHYHLTVVEAMMDGQVFSTLAVTQYAADLPTAQVPFLQNGYYPAAWHVFTAVLGLVANVPATLAENASNYLFAAVVFPMGVSALLQVVFREKRWIVICGAFMPCACVAYPFRPLVVHQLYPNVAAFACVPVSLAAFVQAVELSLAGRPWRALLMMGFLSLAALVLLHPNSVFVLAIFVACFFAFWAAPRFVAKAMPEIAHPKAASWAICLAVVFVSSAIWVGCLNLSFLSGTTSYLWEWTVSAGEACRDLLSLGLRLECAQWPLSILVVAGLIYCVLSHRANWLIAALTVFCFIFYLNATGDPQLKKLVSGYWYTDPERTSALVALAVIPFSAAGTYAVFFATYKTCLAVAKGRYGGRASIAITSVLVVCIVVCVVYRSHNSLDDPGHYSGYGQTAKALSLASDAKTSTLLTQDEMTFLDAAKKLVGSDALIINMPNDGSQFANAVDGLNVYYRSLLLYSSNETLDSERLRLGLNEVAFNQGVQGAVERTGAQYVLQLYLDPQGNYDSNRWNSEDWVGIESITDDTPGFDVVLREGDMRLYRIVV